MKNIFFFIPLQPHLNIEVMTIKEGGYSKQIEEVEAILEKIENGETDIDDLAAEIKRASLLLNECKEKLFRTEQEVEKIMKSEE